MNSTRLISLCVSLNLLACASRRFAALPSSAPYPLYQPIDAQDPTRGFFVSYAAAQEILIAKKKAVQSCGDAKLDLQESNELCEAQLKAQTPDWFSKVGIPILAALSGLGIGLGVGYAAHR